MAAIGPLSRIEWVEGELREAILNGDLQPGERLLTAQLSERFSVSPTPLREALHRFAGEGLVEFLPQKGARVTSLSPSDCKELMELRLLLEPVAVARTIEVADSVWSKKVSEHSNRLLEAWDDEERFARAIGKEYRDFYDALTAACPSERLRRFATVIRDQDARYRMATLPRIEKKRFVAGHIAMVKAALAGDVKATKREIKREINDFGSCYLASCEM